MHLGNYRRRVRRLERAIKPKAAEPVSGKCVSMTFQLWESDPGVTVNWNNAGVTWNDADGGDGSSGSELAEDNADPGARS